MEKNIALFLFLLLSPLFLFGNIAQPGIYSAGGNAGISLLFPEDSAGVKKIQMQEEKIDIQLYRGYAVVKGEYWMFNSSEDTIQIKTGYPLNANYNTYKDASNLTDVRFGELYGLKVFINDQEVEIERKAMINTMPNVMTYRTEGEQSQWYIWKSRFPAKALTKITVYFLVDTNESNVLKGYDQENFNSFIYVLETAASWKLPIGKGQVQIQLMEDLDLSQVRGGSPDSVFQYHVEQKILSYSFKNLFPDRESNIVITYGDHQADFNFAEIFNRREQLFETVDQFSEQKPTLASFSPVRLASPFEISSIESKAIGAIFYLIIYGPILLGALILFLLVRWLIKRSRKKKLQKNPSS